jgi:predicted phage tail protein
MAAVAIHLHGRLRAFGGPHRLHVATAAEAIRALCEQLPGLRAALLRGSWRLMRGRVAMDQRELALGLGAARDLHLLPVPNGRGRGGGKILLGAVIIAGAFIAAPAAAAGTGFLGANMGATAIGGLGITYGNIAMFGVTMILSGVAQMLSPQPKAPKPFEPADRQASWLFEQPVNVSSQGQPVPLVYGRFRTGSVVISAALEAEDYAAGQGSVSVPTILGGKTGVLRSVVVQQ